MLFRNRYNVIHQRLLRNESFQSSAIANSRSSALKNRSNANAGAQTLKITPIANLLGRHGSNHMLLGQLTILPTGELAISDLTGTIALDLKRAICVPHDSSWFCPGMIVVVDGVYEEEDESVGKGLGGSSGVGGVLGGKFQGFFIGQPPCETRKTTLGVSGPDGGVDQTIGGGFGWIDFLGVGSERAVGSKMRRLENRLLAPPKDDMPGRNRVVVIGEVNFDQPRALQALRKILGVYAKEAAGVSPVAFVLTGNFIEHAVMGLGGSCSSIEYKEYFDSLASILSDFPTLLQTCTFVFVPGDNDGWISSFTAGAAAPLPRKGIPELFTSRIRKAFAAANAEEPFGVPGEAIWTSNPSRLSLFGPNHELVIFRDDISARLRRSSVHLTAKAPEMENQENVPPSASQDESMDVDEQPAANEASNPREDFTLGEAVNRHAAQKLVKTILDQGFLSPFRSATRPVHWDYGSPLHLYPLPTAMVLVDATAPPFTTTYEGCHVMNPGTVLVPGRKGVGRWIEYEVGGKGRLREITF